jgi:hypothetical protein
MSLDPAGKGRKRWTNRWKAALGRPHPGCPSLGTPAGGIDRVIRVRPRWPGAVVAAWPAASLVGSYELLIWMIRTAAACGPDRVPAADQTGPQPDHDGTSLRPRSCRVWQRTSEQRRAAQDASQPGRMARCHCPALRRGTRDPDRSGPRWSRRTGIWPAWSQPPVRTATQRRCGRRVPCQRPGRPAAVRAEARAEVREDLQALGAQPHRRSHAADSRSLSFVLGVVMMSTGRHCR